MDDMGFLRGVRGMEAERYRRRCMAGRRSRGASARFPPVVRGLVRVKATPRVRIGPGALGRGAF
jgi:hypothetical protein